MTEPTRLFDFIYFQQENCPLDVAMTSKVAGEWKSYSTSEVIEAVNLASKGLLKLGVQPGDKIALISHNNRCEWNIMDMAILQIGAIDVPIYPTMSENDYEYILNHSESKFCFLSNDELYKKVKNVKDNVPTLQDIYTFEKISGAKKLERGS
jgi:long-chain acyl-CoA synthetase